MKRWIVGLTVIGVFAPVFAEVVKEDFETGHTPGSPPLGWDTKFDENVANLPLQQGLFTVESGVGQDGSRGLSLDVTQAKRLYLTKHPTPISRPTLILSADFQITTSGDVLDGAPGGVPDGSPNGVNDALIGPVVSPDPLWENNPNFSFGFARRSDDHWGLRLPAPEFIGGFIDNSEIGLALGTTPSTSDWFTITMRLTDTGSAWTAFVEVYAEGDATPLFVSSTYTLPATFVSGAPLYGGVTTGWNSDDVPIGEVGKVTAIAVDNFVFGGPTIEITSVTLEDLPGYTYSSIDGKTHRLQYSLNGINFFDTGAALEGDGTEQTLVDPAADTSGRTYRVTSD